jgi:hypothetical protein
LTEHQRRAARLAAIGAPVLLLGQALTLFHFRPLSDYWYGLVWTGFVLLADAVLAARHGGSLVLDRPRELLAMALVSAGLWWLFEGANLIVLGSWSYSPSPDVPAWVQRLRSTYFFATLLPATFFASALALSAAGGSRRPRPGDDAPPGARVRRRVLTAGALLATASAIAVAAWTRSLALPCLLVALGLVLDTVNMWRRRPSLLAWLATGQHGLVVGIAVGNILAGVVGEAWNFPADPRWSYEASYAGSLRLFAMPLPGYLGYAALAFDLFAAYHLVRPRSLDTVQIADPAFDTDHPLRRLGVTGPNLDASFG